MWRFSWTALILSSISLLTSTASAGKFKTPDGQWYWDYNHSTQKALLFIENSEETGTVKAFGAAQNIKLYGRWDEKNLQLLILMDIKEKGVSRGSTQPIPCVLEKDSQGVERFRVTEKDPEQGDWERYLVFGAPGKMEASDGVLHEGQDYLGLLNDYFEKKLTTSMPTGETGFLCKQAVAYKLPGNKLRWNHTIVDGETYQCVETIQQKPALDAPITETQSVRMTYVKILENSPERVKDEAPSPTGCPSHPSKNQLGSYNNPNCLQKYPSYEQFVSAFES